MPIENDNTKHLSKFFSEEYQSLKGYVQSKIRDTTDGDAEDIIQEVALRIFSRSGDLSPIGNVAGFVYRAISNKIIDVLRTRKDKIHDSEQLEMLWADFASLFYGANAEMYSEQLQTKLKLAISELKPTYRNIILAIDFEGYTYKEVAEQTGISQGTLMSRRHRALSLLQRKLKPKI